MNIASHDYQSAVFLQALKRHVEKSGMFSQNEVQSTLLETDENASTAMENDVEEWMAIVDSVTAGIEKCAKTDPEVAAIVNYRPLRIIS